MSQIKDVFARNIEDTIVPVIYFHQLDPETAEKEVSEYVFTTRKVTQSNQLGGIHEQMVALLKQISVSIEEGHKLPASWISGFFGSGKSSFAKLLGLALDQLPLPSGTTMDKALIARDDTPDFKELSEAFDKLNSQINSMAVIFDIGTAAKNDENIPHTIYRHILQKLNYSKHDGVAHFEIALQDEGHYEDFLSRYEQQNNKPWSADHDSALAPQKFRAMYKQIFPEQDDLLEISTFDIHSLSIVEMVSNICKAMERRASGKTIFIVVDEVSQYIDQDKSKMLALQSFVSEIGGRVKNGRSPLWLLVTGQEKLEQESKESVLFKLKDRFPPELRVHLDRTNVKEVVSRRLLKKKAGSSLETFITDAHVDALKLHGYECPSLTKDQLIEHYPLLPGHIALFMDITQNIRSRSTRTQSDAGGVRSVLNNIWDLFNRDPVALKARTLGTLMTIDMLYDIIGSSIDSDVQLTMHKAFEKLAADSWDVKVLKAIALLEMNAEIVPVQLSLLSSLLYPQLGAASVEGDVKSALDNLKKDNWIHSEEKHGWRVQNNAAQDWNREKREISVKESRVAEILIEFQKEILNSVNQPTLEGARFPLESLWGLEQKILGKNDPTKISISFHWEASASKPTGMDEWLNQSRIHKRTFHWVSGDTSALTSTARDYERSSRIIERYKGQGQLQPLQQKLIYHELAEKDRLHEEIKKGLRQVWMQGMLYFNGDSDDMSQSGGSFDKALKASIEKRMPQLFNKFSQGHIQITESDYKQLLEKDTSGLGRVFFDSADSLGIAQNDAGKIIFKCEGQVPKEIYQYLEERTYLTGEQLINYFGADPYGYSASVIKASIIGLLREEKITASDSKKNDITSIQDPGARSLFEQNREFMSAEFEINKSTSLTGRDRTTLRRFFEQSLALGHVESESDALADNVFKHFPAWKDRVNDIKSKLERLHISVPAELKEFNTALSGCLANRQVQKTLERFKQNLETIENGVARVKELEESLNEDTEKELRHLKNLLEVQVVQLQQVDEAAKVTEQINALKDQLQSDKPWRGYADVKPAAAQISDHYQQTRTNYKDRQKTQLDHQTSQIKLRPDFADLDQDKQQDVLQAIRNAAIDIDEQAVQPVLLVLKQTPDRIHEASSTAHHLLDELINEVSELPDRSDDPEPTVPKAKIHIVKLGLRNKVIVDRNELEQALTSLRDKCLKELDMGNNVRFEE